MGVDGLGALKSLEPIVDGSSRVLILGSMPGNQSLRAQQYYANPGNHFWRIVYAIFGREVDNDYEQKKKFILERGIALWDVIRECEREGSLDSKIKSAVPNSLKVFLRRYQGIRYVAFNGTKAFQLFMRLVELDGKSQYVCKLLPSTSAARAVRLESKVNDWKIIRDWLGD